MDNKVKAIIAYIFFPIGWIIALVANKNADGKKDSFVSYHLEQALGLGIVMFVLFFVLRIIAVIFLLTVPVIAAIIGILLMLVGLAAFVFMIMGIINAANMRTVPLPLIGKMFEGKFGFLK